MSETKTFDYTQVPHGFIHCLKGNCPQAASCLRYLAFTHVPDETLAFSLLSPKQVEKQKSACPHYLDHQPVRFARGFMRTVNALPVGKSETFRIRLIAYFGRKNYYLSRRGNRLLTPSEQQRVITIARQLGIQLEDYFDRYESRLCWENLK